MYRITRGHHVQHIHFPLPIIRDLDGPDDEAAHDDPRPPDAAPSVTAKEAAVEIDPSTDAPQ